VEKTFDDERGRVFRGSHNRVEVYRRRIRENIPGLLLHATTTTLSKPPGPRKDNIMTTTSATNAISRRAITTGFLTLAPFVIVTIVAATASAQTFPAMYVFGDSLSDVGNVYNTSTLSAAWNFAGYTGTYNGPANFPGPAYPTTSNGTMNAALLASGAWTYTKGAFTDGSDTTPSTTTSGNWAQQLAADLSLPLTASSSGGTDYAYGGATTANTTTNIVTTTSSYTFGNGYTVTSSAPINNIGKQVSTFQATLGLGQANSSALYVIWGGGNDILNTPSADLFPGTEQTAMLNLTNNIQSLYNSGARYFLWPDLPPMAAIPRYLGTNALISAAVSNACATFKTQEDASILTLKNNDPGIKIGEVDILSLFTNLLANPGASSFTNTTGQARRQLGNPDLYLFWDDVHPTTATDTLIASAAVAALAQIPEPSTLSLVLLPAAMLLTLRRRKRKAVSSKVPSDGDLAT